MTDYNTWIEHLREERKKIAEKLERLGDKPVMSQQERQRIADKTRVTITTNQ